MTADPCIASNRKISALDPQRKHVRMIQASYPFHGRARISSHLISHHMTSRAMVHYASSIISSARHHSVDKQRDKWKRAMICKTDKRPTKTKRQAIAQPMKDTNNPSSKHKQQKEQNRKDKPKQRKSGTEQAANYHAQTIPIPIPIPGNFPMLAISIQHKPTLCQNAMQPAHTTLSMPNFQAQTKIMYACACRQEQSSTSIHAPSITCVS